MGEGGTFREAASRTPDAEPCLECDEPTIERCRRCERPACDRHRGTRPRVCDRCEDGYDPDHHFGAPMMVLGFGLAGALIWHLLAPPVQVGPLIPIALACTLVVQVLVRRHARARYRAEHAPEGGRPDRIAEGRVHFRTLTSASDVDAARAHLESLRTRGWGQRVAAVVMMVVVIALCVGGAVVFDEPLRELTGGDEDSSAAMLTFGIIGAMAFVLSVVGLAKAGTIVPGVTLALELLPALAERVSERVTLGIHHGLPAHGGTAVSVQIGAMSGSWGWTGSGESREWRIQLTLGPFEELDARRSKAARDALHEPSDDESSWSFRQDDGWIVLGQEFVDDPPLERALRQAEDVQAAVTA